MSHSALSRIASEIDQIPYQFTFQTHQNLAGRVTHDETTVHADHTGGYADVFLGWLRGNDGTKTKVAIKVLRVINEPEPVMKIKTYLIRETAVWVKLNHPNILKFLGLAPDHERFGVPALISPYCNNGTVYQYLGSHPNINTKLFIMKGVASGLQYLHQTNIVHGDLKPSNILIHDDGRPLLCDFGRSKILTQQGFTTKPAGTARYQAPELLEGKIMSPDKPADVYAFGVTCYEIWTGSKPFPHIQSDYGLIIHIIVHKGTPSYPEAPVPQGTDFVWRPLEDCWKREAEKRSTMDVVVEKLEKISFPVQ
ncbi:kinase-like protein [Macrolepiota fuliginosa MF-IS2]|uniref:Kinase-like protein n=1 Tax=Macrolepiota fuliginosa MF-IS2 TaxID=1400762 RepID=A0A9P5XEN8_9AGAR|nr:kinase-like protein [Macrolepiota fuliginosa MF-IS2]